MKHAQSVRRRVRNYGVLSIVLMLLAAAWYDKIAVFTQGLLSLPNAGAPLEAGIMGPAPPPTGIVFDGVRDKGKSLVETITLIGSALGALAVAVGKILDALNNGVEA